MAQQPPVGQGLFTVEAARLDSDTAHSVEILWTSNQPDAETSTLQLTTLTRDRPPCSQGESNPQSQQANSRGPTPYTALLLGSAIFHDIDSVIQCNKFQFSTRIVKTDVVKCYLFGFYVQPGDG